MLSALLLVPSLITGLPAPENLRVDLLDAPGFGQPYVTVTKTSTPSFSFLAAGNMYSANASMTEYQIKVYTTAAGAGELAWDSGRVKAAAAVNIQYAGARLSGGVQYTWEAMYAAGGTNLSPPAFGHFVCGAELPWKQAKWVGGGQRQFAVYYPQHHSITNAVLHIASPGGAAVSIGDPRAPAPKEATYPSWIGDEVGISMWTSAADSMQFISYNVSGSPTFVITIGGGFYVSSRGKDKGGEAVVKFMLVDSADGSVLLHSGEMGGAGQIFGRAGPVTRDDPWQGTVTDTTVANAANWVGPQGATPGRALSALNTTTFFPLPLPYSRTRQNISPISVEAVASRPGAFLYKFPANIVGHASLLASSAQGFGNITLEFCEVYNKSLEGAHGTGCLPYVNAAIEPGSIVPCAGKHGCDTYTLGSAGAETPTYFAPKFTWHGFQYVTVVPSEGVQFTGHKDALVAHWTTADVKVSS